MLNIEMSKKNYKPLEETIIYLNSEVGCTKITDGGTKNVEFIWNIPSMCINEFSKLKVFNLSILAGSYGDHSNNVITFRLKNILYNQSVYYSTDGSSFPIIFSGTFTSNEPVYWDTQGSSLTIIPQTINTISIILSDSLTDQMAGIVNTISFLIGINISEYDLKMSEINNPYK